MATRSTAAGLRHRPRFTQILPTLGMTNDLSIATTSSRGRPSRLLRSPRREACGSTGAPSFPPQPSRRLGWWALAWRAVCTRQPAIQIPTDGSSVFPLPEGWFTSCELTTGAVPGLLPSRPMSQWACDFDRAGRRKTYAGPCPIFPSPLYRTGARIGILENRDSRRVVQRFPDSEAKKLSGCAAYGE